MWACLGPQGMPMKRPEETSGGLTRQQGAWDSYAAEVRKRIRLNPTEFDIGRLPWIDEPWAAPLLDALQLSPNKRIVELGCGLGETSVYLSKTGVSVTGLDYAFHAVAAARDIAALNRSAAMFARATMQCLPFANSSIDAVFGINVLHHLSIPDVPLVLSETHRVLRFHGNAVFLEPIENSRLFDFVQNVFVSGSRPSCLNRRRWKAYVARLEDRNMTNSELARAGALFSRITIAPYGLTSRLEGVFTSGWARALMKGVDAIALRVLGRYARSALVRYDK